MKSIKEWISISDMMTGLMMVFLFIAILYMHQVQEKNKKIEKLTIQHINYKKLILKKLKTVFQEDLEKWKAEIIEKTLTIRFLSPDIMFSAGSSVIKKDFKKILNDFCPRYFNILYELKNGIEEIRIDGHTSDEWEGVKSKEAYFQNMRLSQERTRAVLRHCTTIKSIDKNINQWAIGQLTANGLSSSRPVCREDTVKCRFLNRRVEFRIQINESNILSKVIKIIKIIAPKEQKIAPEILKK